MVRVLLTRPHGRTDALSARLQAAGHDVLHLPLTIMQTLASPAPQIADPAGIIFTSPAALQALGQTNALPTQYMALPALCVGRATMECAREHALPHAIDCGGDIDALSAELRARGGHWLYPCGAQLSRSPEVIAAASGADIQDWVVYDMPAAPRWSSEQIKNLAAFAPECALLLSVRAATLLSAQIETGQLEPVFSATRFAVMSAPIGQSLPAWAQRQTRIASAKTIDAALAAGGIHT